MVPLNGWGLALSGLMLMVVSTPAVVIKHTETVKPLLLTQSVRSADTIKPISIAKICRMGETHGITAFDLDLYNKSKAVAMRFTKSHETSVALQVPRPVNREDWIRSIARKVSTGADSVITVTKDASKKLFDLTKRTVSGNGQRMVLDKRTARLFVELERRWGERLEVRWAYRDSRLNKKVGGKSKSFHLKKQAVDIVHNGWSKSKMRRFVRLAYDLGFRGFGMGRNVIHIDTRSSLTSWNYGGNIYGLAYSMVKK